jgi:uncharacterized protein (TIGR03084 family)
MDDAIVDDLAAEQAALDALVDGLDEAAWDTPTPAEGWNVRDQIAHLAFFDEVAVASVAGDGLARFGDMAARRGDPHLRSAPGSPGTGRTGADVLAWWRTARREEVTAFERVDRSAQVRWGPNDMAAASLCTARLMETWAHGLDCFTALGVDPVDTERLRHVCHITYRAIPHAFRDAQLHMPGALDDLVVEVSSPSGGLWRFGLPSASQRIEGSAAEFARVGVRRLKLSEATTLKAEGTLAAAALGTLKAYL